MVKAMGGITMVIDDFDDLQELLNG